MKSMAGSNIRVLIVEDDLRIAEVNRRFVEKVEGYEVVGIATNGQEARDQLELLQPDLVLLDIYFPDMDGLDFLSVMKEEFPVCDCIMAVQGRQGTPADITSDVHKDKKVGQKERINVSCCRTLL
ncbi:hypothetical protein BAG01nite_11210 [Brevibacillus agri]|uniref:Response regulator n=1 Tax=Brevibacillus agri TaxID=51101 RepID=A0A3M8AKC9_9BACL|nr:response regulator of citrate/malate metabolism [Brevibacillus sp. CF112]ELK43070.1 two-component response regulator [Brevibacillus agri BAB-2500]MBG9566065.1 two-component response regulator [Brevibacillus agri]QHZ55529.1 response regulator [Brevibacillus sp. NSP2.1]MBY0051043.1 response regulator [Brevibacillus agri]